MIKFLEKLNLPVWLEVLFGLVLLLRIPSFIEPYYYGDEMIYLTLGEGIRQGVPLYLGLHDNKPPLLYLTSALAGRLFWFKVILAFTNLFSIALFYKLAVALFPKNKRLHLVSTVTFALLTTLPLLEGNIANAELFMIGPIIAGFLLLFIKRNTPLLLLISGFLFSLALLFKVPAVFDIPAIFIFWLITKGLNFKNIKSVVYKSSFVLLGVATTVFITFLWFWAGGGLKEYVIAAFLQNVGYVSSWRANDVEISFLAKNTPLFIRAAIVIAGSFLLYIKRKSLPKEFIFITLWLLFGLFGATLSERPYPHYLIQVVPAVALLIGILVSSKTRIQTFVVIPLALTLMVPVYFGFWHYSTIAYYSRFVRFALGQTTKQEYLKSFSPEVPRNYEIARLMNDLTKPKDKIFVWGSDSTIYALSKRLPPVKYVANYHITDFSSNEEVYAILLRSLPEMVIVNPNQESFPELNKLLSERYILLTNIRGAEVWKLVKIDVLEGTRFKLLP